jgi:hypothetical protein
MELFRVTGLLVEESRPEPAPRFAPRYGWRHATARWLDGPAGAARDTVAACCSAERRPACAEC